MRTTRERRGVIGQGVAMAVLPPAVIVASMALIPYTPPVAIFDQGELAFAVSLLAFFALPPAVARSASALSGESGRKFVATAVAVVPFGLVVAYAFAQTSQIGCAPTTESDRVRLAFVGFLVAAGSALLASTIYAATDDWRWTVRFTVVGVAGGLTAAAIVAALLAFAGPVGVTCNPVP